MPHRSKIIRKINQSDVAKQVVKGSPVRNGELPEVHADHVSRNQHEVEHFAIINGYLGSNHFRNNHHVSKMGLHGGWLVERSGSYIDESVRQ